MDTNALGHEMVGPEEAVDGPELGGAVAPTLPPAPASEMELAPAEPRELDYYEVYPERGALCRTHVERRVKEWNPNDLPGQFAEADLPKRRLVEKEFAAGGRDVVEDERGGTPRPHRDVRGRRVRVTRKTPGARRGRTWFFLKKLGEGDDAPKRKRYSKKETPRDASEIDRMSKQSGAGLATRGILPKGLSIHGIERVRFANAQRECPGLKAVYTGKLLEPNGLTAVRKGTIDLKRKDPRAFQQRNVDSVIRSLDDFEVNDRLLHKRVWVAFSGEVELKRAVPPGTARLIDFPGRGHKPMPFRKELMMQYHNGPLGGHRGRERTMELIARDYWWPGMFKDTRAWRKTCEFRRGEPGATGVAAWTRTELYTCPFRVLQLDAITCDQKYALTCVCCFSRWVWLVVVPDRSAETIADALMRIFCDCGGFPVVLRSDNTAEFVSSVVRHLNAALEIKRTTGSSYHPQPQGALESIHKTLNHLVRGLVRGDPDKRESMLMPAQLLLRVAPMKCLGGRTRW